MPFTQTSFAEGTAYLRGLMRGLLNACPGVEVEEKDSDAELTALGKAKAIMFKKFALVQTTAKVHALS